MMSDNGDAAQLAISGVDVGVGVVQPDGGVVQIHHCELVLIWAAKTLNIN